MKRIWILTYLAAAAALLAADMVWLLGIAGGWYQEGLGHLLAAGPRLLPAAAFYLGLPAGIVFFAVDPPRGLSLAQMALRGGFLGLLAYGTYDLTCLALLRDWPVGLSLLDMGWGVCACALSAVAGGWAMAIAKRKEGQPFG